MRLESKEMRVGECMQEDSVLILRQTLTSGTRAASTTGLGHAGPLEAEPDVRPGGV